MTVLPVDGVDAVWGDEQAKSAKVHAMINGVFFIMIRRFDGAGNTKIVEVDMSMKFIARRLRACVRRESPANIGHPIRAVLEIIHESPLLRGRCGTL